MDILPTLLSHIGVANPPDEYSNGMDLFDPNYKREFAFVANWNNNAIITNTHTLIFSNLPNKMFDNQIRDTKTYKTIKTKQNFSSLVLQSMKDNSRFKQ